MTKRAIQAAEIRRSLRADETAGSMSSLSDRGNVGFLSASWVVGTWIGVSNDFGDQWIIILPAIFLCVAAMLMRRIPRLLNTTLMGVVLVLMAISWSTVVHRKVDVSESRFLAACDGRIVEVHGTIRSIGRSDDRRVGEIESFGVHGMFHSVSMVDVQFPDRFVPVAKKINRIEAHINTESWGDVPWKVGDRIRVRGRLCSSRPPSNPGCGRMMDRKSWIDVPTPNLVRFVGRPRVSMGTFVADLHDGWKRLVEEKMRSIIAPWGGEKASELVLSMTLGRRSSGYDEMAEPYRMTGTAHYLAVSGFAFGVLSTIQLLATSRLSRNVRMPLLVTGAILAFLSMDARTPAMRAVTIIVISSVASSLRREWSRSSILGVSAVVILLTSPREVVSAGFHLSFVVVAALVNLSSSMERGLPFGDVRDEGSAMSVVVAVSRRVVACGMVAWIASTPILLHHFGNISTIGSVCSILASPIVACIIGSSILGLIMSFVWEPLGHVFGAPCAWSAMSLDLLVGCASSIPGSFMVTHRPSLMWTVCCVASIFWILSRRTRRLSASIACLTGFLLWFAAEVMVAGIGSPQRLVTLDVGNGSCHIFQSGSGCVMVDCGSMSRRNLSSTTIIPAMKRLGVTKIDVMFLTHANLDHYAALGDLAGRFPIGRICIGESFMNKAAEETEGPESRLLGIIRDWRIELLVVESGWEERIGDQNWKVLHPPDSYRSGIENDSSLVISVRQEGTEEPSRSMIMFTGDIEEDGMRDLMESHPDEMMTHVLEAPHHGSVRPSTNSFVDSSSPSIIIQSTGPRRMIVDRFGSSVEFSSRFVTSRDGAIEIRFEEGRPTRVVTHLHRDH